METKYKTWEDCCDEMAQELHYDNYSNWMFGNKSDELLVVVFHSKAAQLFDQETAKERDELKKDYNSKIDSLKQLNSELVKSLDEIIRYYERHYRVPRHYRLPYVWQPYKMAKEALSKVSDGYTKAKD